MSALQFACSASVFLRVSFFLQRSLPSPPNPALTISTVLQSFADAASCHVCSLHIFKSITNRICTAEVCLCAAETRRQTSRGLKGKEQSANGVQQLGRLANRAGSAGVQHNTLRLMNSLANRRCDSLAWPQQCEAKSEKGYQLLVGLPESGKKQLQVNCDGSTATPGTVHLLCGSQQACRALNAFSLSEVCLNPLPGYPATLLPSKPLRYKCWFQC